MHLACIAVVEGRAHDVRCRLMGRAGEEFEGVCSLVNGELAAGHDWRPAALARIQQRRPERRIDRIGDPESARSRACRHRRVAVRQHADRGAIDHAGGARERILDVSATRVTLPSASGAATRPWPVGVEDAQFAHAEVGQRKGDRLADAAGADKGDGAAVGGLTSGRTARGKAGGVGVVSGRACHREPRRY